MDNNVENKFKRIIVPVIAFVILLTPLFIFIIIPISCESQQQSTNLTSEQVDLMLHYLDQVNKQSYAQSVYLRPDRDDRILDVLNYGVERGHGFSVVFVHDMEEMVDPPNDVIFFFPGEMTLGFIEGLNDHVKTGNIDLSRYSLTYPLTIDDVITNWQDVSTLHLNEFCESSECLSAKVIANWSNSSPSYRTLRRCLSNLIVIEMYSELYQERFIAEKGLTELDVHMLQLLRMGQALKFEHNKDMRFMDLRSEIENGSSQFVGIEFVHRKEEAIGFPDNVIIMWPTMASTLAVESFSRWLDRPTFNRLDVSDFSLRLPVTVDVLVNEWEIVFVLWQESLTPDTRDFIKMIALPLRVILE